MKSIHKRKRLSKIDENKLIRWIKDKLKKTKDKIKISSAKPGSFYTFEYDSKMYEEGELPYYDKQPLILLLSKGGGYYLGLNFHYLPPSVRKDVLDRLKSRFKKQWSADKILPNVTWSNVRGQVRHSQVMVKLYLENRMGTMSRVKNTEMEQVIDLKSEDFIGIDPDKLWKDLGF
jgi:hypothetical protein